MISLTYNMIDYTFASFYREGWLPDEIRKVEFNRKFIKFLEINNEKLINDAPLHEMQISDLNFTQSEILKIKSLSDLYYKWDLDLDFTKNELVKLQLILKKAKKDEVLTESGIMQLIAKLTEESARLEKHIYETRKEMIRNRILKYTLMGDALAIGAFVIDLIIVPFIYIINLRKLITIKAL